MKEEKVLDKAIDIIDAALSGRVVDPNALQTAQSITMMLWSTVYQERLKKEQMKEALREVWAEEIKKDEQ